MLLGCRRGIILMLTVLRAGAQSCEGVGVKKREQTYGKPMIIAARKIRRGERRTSRGEESRYEQQTLERRDKQQVKSGVEDGVESERWIVDGLLFG